MSYHPNYFDPKGSHRSDCEHRLNLIKETIGTEAVSVLDVGCSGGYYSFGLREHGKGHVLGLDTEQDLIYRCDQLKKEHDLKNIDFMCQEISDYLIHSKDRFNTCLYMSVHHHVIARHGMALSAYLLKTLSNRCRVMYFDMGQKNENCSQHRWWNLLPICIEQKDWLVSYLHENTFFKKIEVIGSSEIHGVERYFIRMEQ